jgi:hypothetical protein
MTTITTTRLQVDPPSTAVGADAGETLHDELRGAARPPVPLAAGIRA